MAFDKSMRGTIVSVEKRSRDKAKYKYNCTVNVQYQTCYSSSNFVLAVTNIDFNTKSITSDTRLMVGTEFTHSLYLIKHSFTKLPNHFHLIIFRFSTLYCTFTPLQLSNSFSYCTNNTYHRSNIYQDVQYINCSLRRWPKVKNNRKPEIRSAFLLMRSMIL